MLKVKYLGHYVCYLQLFLLESLRAVIQAKLAKEDIIPISTCHQNVLIINSWPHCMKGGKEFRAVGIKEGGERVADVTRIIT